MAGERLGAGRAVPSEELCCTGCQSLSQAAKPLQQHHCPASARVWLWAFSLLIAFLVPSHPLPQPPPPLPPPSLSLPSSLPPEPSPRILVLLILKRAAHAPFLRPVLLRLLPASPAPAPPGPDVATDSWAPAVDKQQAAAESSLHLKDEKTKPDANGAVVKVHDDIEKAEDEKEDRAAQSLLNKLIRSNLVDTTNQVEVLQRDPTSPLSSVKSFEELRLKPQLLQGVYAMGFNRPSKIQEKALPMMLAEPPQNLIAQSQSGTGKTAAFVLAMLSRVERGNKYPR
ncbi:LOW QUALITY PROTEIN: ATP-dependent RNA helicase DDX19B-like, partial [Nyctibius grandis]|uniref:LOW QUALITY PROTEIN: ATP-dependent RNA helicase DDX19B-like n=1 Tax=Nyctibius grandis TaxID=48427 RepID=UPI0035BBF14E